MTHYLRELTVLWVVFSWAQWGGSSSFCLAQCVSEVSNQSAGQLSFRNGPAVGWGHRNDQHISAFTVLQDSLGFFTWCLGGIQ